MTIDEIYKIVKILANKENRGWIKPSEFNLLAKRVQLDIIKDRIGKVSPDGTNNGYRDDASIQDELRTVMEESGALSSTTSGHSLPTSYLHFISAKYNEYEIDMVNHGEITKRKRSQLNPPSSDSPIGVIIGDYLRVYISSGEFVEGCGVVKMMYIKEPTAPSWAYNTLNNVEVYNSSSSVQIALPESTHKEVIHRILAYVGVTLREKDVVEFGTSTVLEQNK